MDLSSSNAAQSEKEIVMRVARSFVIVVSMMLVTTTGAFAARKHGHAGVRVKQPSLQEFLKKLNNPQESLIECDIFCDGTDNPQTDQTFPGTISGCLADCEEICGGPCEIAN